MAGGQFSLYKAKQYIALLGTHCADTNGKYAFSADGYLHHRLASPVPLVNRGGPYFPGFRPSATGLLPGVFRPSGFGHQAHTGRGSHPAYLPPLYPHRRVLPDSRETRQGRAAGLKPNTQDELLNMKDNQSSEFHRRKRWSSLTARLMAPLNSPKSLPHNLKCCHPSLGDSIFKISLGTFSVKPKEKMG